MATFVEFCLHLEQQLVLEQWALTRKLEISIPDFTDYLRLRLNGLVSDYKQIDQIYQVYQEWEKKMQSVE